ncbi:type II toxin-antitoxin system RelE/ParE family toxin [Candidatus Woesearchaeota archaeon]|nr:type II toxin-antitoxin system RelE/ParE family toxin [Candidatus Woesearchaeota archaeon]
MTRSSAKRQSSRSRRQEQDSRKDNTSPKPKQRKSSDYRILFDEKAIDVLENIQQKKKIYNKIISTKENPFRYFKKLKDSSGYRMRVGDYRIISDIYEKTIHITAIGHRSTIYKRTLKKAKR